MKLRLLSLIFVLALGLSIWPQKADALTLTNPLAGNCYAHNQIVTLSWTKTTEPAANHYAVTYRTDGKTPPTWESNPSAWLIGHDFGSTAATSIGWKTPLLNSTRVKIWVETHKNNHSRLEIAGSGNFTVKANCSGTTPPSPPPSISPPPAPTPPASNNIAPPGFETGATVSATPASSVKLGSKGETVEEDSKSLGLLEVFGILYFGAFVVFLFMVGLYFKKHTSLPKLRRVPIKPKPKLAPAQKKKKDTDLTIQDLNALRKEQNTP